MPRVFRCASNSESPTCICLLRVGVGLCSCVCSSRKRCSTWRSATRAAAMWTWPWRPLKLDSRYIVYCTGRVGAMEQQGLCLCALCLVSLSVSFQLDPTSVLGLQLRLLLLHGIGTGPCPLGAIAGSIRLWDTCCFRILPLAQVALKPRWRTVCGACAWLQPTKTPCSWPRCACRPLAACRRHCSGRHLVQLHYSVLSTSCMTPWRVRPRAHPFLGQILRAEKCVAT